MQNQTDPSTHITNRGVDAPFVPMAGVGRWPRGVLVLLPDPHGVRSLSGGDGDAGLLGCPCLKPVVQAFSSLNLGFVRILRPAFLTALLCSPALPGFGDPHDGLGEGLWPGGLVT